MANKIHVKTGDKVVIISGKDKGKQGKVLEVSPKEGKIIIEGCNLVTKHVKPRQMGEQGGIVKAEAPMYAFAVASSLESRIILDITGAEKLVGRGDMLYFPLGSGKPTRVHHKVNADGTKERQCKCGETF